MRHESCQVTVSLPGSAVSSVACALRARHGTSAGEPDATTDSISKHINTRHRDDARGPLSLFYSNFYVVLCV